MTILSTVRSAGPYTGTGLVKDYPFAFKVFDASEVLVQETDASGTPVTTALGPDYSVIFNADQDANPGGIVRLTAFLPSGYQLVIGSDVKPTQPAVLQLAGGFLPKVIENALDRLTALILQLGSSALTQTLRIPEIVGIGLLPKASDRANRVLAFDSVGNPVTLVGVDAGSAAALDLDLRDSSNSIKGDAIIAVKRTSIAGAVATTLHTWNERSYHDPIRDHGAKFDGVSDDTVALQAALTAAGLTGLPVFLPSGTAITTRLSLPTGLDAFGCGNGNTVLKLKAGTNTAVMRNAGYGGAGNPRIVLRDFTIDGNYTAQSGSANGLELDRLTDFSLGIEVKNARSMGVVITNSDRGKLTDQMRVSTCGKLEAGYGVYIFCSDNITTIGGDYDDCCIGIAVEASGATLHSNNVKIVSPRCRNNRADFGQSGAGVHFEASAGGVVDNCTLIDPTCIGSTGCGINNTAVALTIQGGLIANNTKSGVTTSGAIGFNYDGVRMTNNGAGDTPGYQTQMRFDDTGLNPGSTGTVTNCYARGSTSEGFKTLSAFSAVRFDGNDVSGFTTNYTRASVNDTLAYSARGSFTATLTGCTTSPTGSVGYSINGDLVTLSVPAISATSNTTAATLTGMPAAIRPSVQRSVIGAATDNGVNVFSWIDIATTGTITLRNGTSAVFTGSGTKGVQVCEVSYRL